MSELEKALQKFIDLAVNKAIETYIERLEQQVRAWEKYLKPSEVAKQLQISNQRVYDWIHSGRLPYYNLGARGYKISSSDLKLFLNQYYHGELKRRSTIQKLIDI